MCSLIEKVLAMAEDKLVYLLFLCSAMFQASLTLPSLNRYFSLTK